MIIKQYNSPEETAKGLIEELLLPALSKGNINLAISGGSTPKLLFEIMASPQYRTSLKWENLHLYWVDERCVAPDDAQSNYGMTAKALDLKHLPLKTEQIYRIQGECPPEDEAKRYTQLVEEKLDRSSNNLPSFDIILLGIGDDGHTSSIFPHQMELLEETTPYVVATSPVGQKRICLAGQTILASKLIAFHAVGANKQEILRQIQYSQAEAESYPSNYFARKRSDILLFTDQSL